MAGQKLSESINKNTLKDEFEVELTNLIYGGDCMGRLADGRAVFVPFTLPGERVRLRVVEEKQNFIRAELVELLIPSKDRITPLCPHFSKCGGCHYQHMNYSKQLEYKESILAEQLERIGGIKNPPVQPINASPEVWNYRNTIQFHLDAAGKVGFLIAGSHQVLAIEECFLPQKEINDLWPLLDLEPVPGLERIELRAGAADDLMLVLKSSAEVPPEFSSDIPLSVVHIGKAGEIILAGNGYVVNMVAGKTFSISAGSFFQVNTSQAEAMVKHLLQELPLRSTDKVLDVYCGVGLFSAHLAERVAHCTGVELSPTACTDFVVNLDLFDNVDLYEGAAETILPELTLNPEIVIVDPPRSGLDRRVLDALVKMQPDTLAYVSCDPATLARDTRRLVGAGYHLEKVTAFDLFPQTFHMETVALFNTKHS
jgi:23S rRNA (uracil1939-C5)-methyltransferase